MPATELSSRPARPPEPAPAACAATELARLPVEAQARVVKPSSLARDAATATTVVRVAAYVPPAVFLSAVYTEALFLVLSFVSCSGLWLMLDTSLVLREYVGIDGACQVTVAKEVQIQVVERRTANRALVERQIPCLALLREDAFFVAAGHGSPRPDANPHPAVIANRRIVRGLDRQCRDLGSSHNDFPNGNAGERENLSVVPNGTQIQQELVRDGNA